ncbi:MAG TPA: tetratricopeptide repeat protein [Puia sp.]|jgi:tetratricopeptide (TPR) repeat protein
MTIETKFDNAVKLESQGKLEEAIQIYHDIILLAPDWLAPYFNLGLIQKHRGQWKESYDNNKKATELAPHDDGSWWNLGIAATALRRWEMAKQAWNHFGLHLPITDREPRLNMPMTPIRLNPEDKAEVVWGRRIDPARATLENVPLPDSNFRYKDLVLNDGAPVGYRISEGKSHPVLNVLQLIERSSFKTYSLTAFAKDRADIETLHQLCQKEGIGFDDWSNIKFICKQCSEGVPHEHHELPLNREGITERIFGFAAITEESLVRVLNAWLKATGCKCEELYLELE